MSGRYPAEHMLHLDPRTHAVLQWGGCWPPGLRDGEKASFLRVHMASPSSAPVLFREEPVSRHLASSPDSARDPAAGSSTRPLSPAVPSPVRKGAGSLSATLNQCPEGTGPLPLLSAVGPSCGPWVPGGGLASAEFCPVGRLSAVLRSLWGEGSHHGQLLMFTTEPGTRSLSLLGAPHGLGSKVPRLSPSLPFSIPSPGDPQGAPASPVPAPHLPHRELPALWLPCSQGLGRK